MRDDRRTSHSVKIIERAEAAAPPLLAFEGVGDQAEIGEEYVNAVVVGGGRGGSGIVGAEEFLATVRT